MATNAEPKRGIALLVDAIVTLTAVLVAFAAFDDITTDGTATGFVFEYVALVACGVALALVAIRIYRAGHPILGVLSFAALAAALWGQRAIRPGLVPGLRAEYLATAAALFWFAALSLVLLALGWRAHNAQKGIG